ncbi:hypothetical protein THIOKS11170027 [Thiocapsa sp. KS1]|nr:hypothetical protein THIOKS11170027 [Thiocapsa sp. KS1]
MVPASAPWRSVAALAVIIADIVLELGVFAEKGQAGGSDGPVALLGDDDLGDTLVLRVLVIDLVAIDEDDEVCILFDCARLAQIRHHGPLVRPLLETAIELRERDDRDVELLGECLERAGDRGDFGRPILADTGGLHELDVVEHDQTQIVLIALETPCARPDLGRREGGCVVDEHGCAGQDVDRRGQARPLVFLQSPGPDTVLIDAPERRHHAHRQRIARHLHAEDRHRALGLDGDMLGHVHRERGFAHRRAPRHDDEIRGLQPRGHHVEVGEAGRQPGDGLVALIECVDALDRAAEQGLDRLEPAAAARLLLGDLEDASLGRIEQLGGIAPHGVVAAVGDIGTGGDHLPQHRGLADDLGVGLDVGRARGLVDDASEIRQATRAFQLLGALEGLGEGYNVEGLVRSGELGDGLEDEAVLAPIEVTLGDHVGDAVPGAVVQHETAEQGLLGVDVVRRDAQLVEVRARGGALGIRVEHRSPQPE